MKLQRNPFNSLAYRDAVWSNELALRRLLSVRSFLLPLLQRRPRLLGRLPARAAPPMLTARPANVRTEAAVLLLRPRFACRKIASVQQSFPPPGGGTSFIG